MIGVSSAPRRVQAPDVAFGVFLIWYAAASRSLLPYDFTDLCYLFSLERGAWVTQEWVHPIYVPTLRLLSGVLGAFGDRGHMLVPVELMNIAVASAAYVLLYALARRVCGPSFAAVAAVAVAATSTGFWSATVRSTPYALALLCQVISLSLLVSDRPVSPRRYAFAGAFAGLAMGYHASAMALGVAALVCALFDPDPARTRRQTVARIAAFGGAMVGVAIAAWAVFFAYNGLGAEFLRRQDLHETFLGIEQVPNTSIYTSRSAAAQIWSFVATMSFQAGVVVRLAAVVLVLALARRAWTRRPLESAERRLALVAAGNFAGIAGFFVINNTHNGFIFASLTLVPVVIAAVIGRSWVGLALLAYLALPATIDNVHRMMQAGMQAATDPQLSEVRFLEQTLHDRDVLLTPGSPFPEMLYLSHLNVFEISAGERTRRGSEVPVLKPGETLRARVAWWLGNGSRVLYALGDESTDFTGDVSGAEKESQIFWRSETAARDRGPMLRALRAGVESSGIELRETLTSPRGHRYAEVGIREPMPRTPPSGLVRSGVTSGELRTRLVAKANGPDDQDMRARIRFLTNVEAASPDDPWLVCDWMTLTCEWELGRDGKRTSCRPVEGCDEWIGQGHLTPGVGQIVHEAAAEVLPQMLPNGFTVRRVDVRGDTIELTIRDIHQEQYGITLALPGSKQPAEQPDGRGRNFLFYVAPADKRSNPAATDVLLAAAARLDEAIPDAALRSD